MGMATMDRLVLKGGRVIDPRSGVDEVRDLVIEGGRVAASGRGLGPAGDDGDSGAPRGAAPPSPRHGFTRLDGAWVFDARGLVVAPGFIDLHAHLRTPGQEWKEDIASGTRAAAAGGFTAVCCMPNTVPPVDNAAMVELIRRRAAEEGVVRVYPIGCITRGQAGEALAELGEMREAGAVAVSDDGRPVMNAELMRCALQYAAMFGLPVSVHEEDLNLAAGGVMHQGEVASRLGLRGQPAAAEATMVARDVLLAELTGGHVHIAHVSAAASVEIIRRARERGVRVTAEATPHHLVLTDAAVAGERGAGPPGVPYDTSAKCNPPLRSEADRLALRAALRDGVIDAIATDHAPHHRDDKDVEFDRAAFGISGLETALGLVWTELVGGGWLTPAQAVDRLSSGPARVFGLPGGSLAPGAPADVTVFDPEAEWVVDPAAFHSKGRNTPFAGRRLRGRVVLTLVGGRVAFARDGDAAGARSAF